MIEFIKQNNSLCYSIENEIIKIQPWGRNGIRVQSRQSNEIKLDWISALINQGDHQSNIKIDLAEASLQNGEIKVTVTSKGELSFINVISGKELIKEKPIHALSIPARAYKGLQGDLFHIECCFESYEIGRASCRERV